MYSLPLVFVAASAVFAQGETQDYAKLKAEKAQVDSESSLLITQRNSLQKQIAQDDAAVKVEQENEAGRDILLMEKMTLQVKLIEVNRAIFKKDAESQKLENQIITA